MKGGRMKRDEDEKRDGRDDYCCCWIEGMLKFAVELLVDMLLLLMLLRS